MQKLRFSGAAPGRYLTRAALAGAFIFVGILTELEDKTGLIKRFHTMHKQLQQIAEDAEKTSWSATAL